MIILYLLIILFSLFPSCGWAACDVTHKTECYTGTTTKTVIDCANDTVNGLHVQWTVDSASTGDIVVIPAGSCTWDTTVTITGKNITLQGTGTLGTIITTADAAISSANTSSRITNIKFLQSSPGNNVIVMTGKGWSVDNNWFDGTGADGNDYSCAIKVNIVTGDATTSSGVIYKNTFVDEKVIFLGSGVSTARAVWFNALTLGAANEPNDTVYVEGNTFTTRTGGAFIDANYGGSYVLRWNDFLSTNVNPILAHSNTSPAGEPKRGVRKWEVYSNRFETTLNTAASLKSGTGVFYNNYSPLATGNKVSLDNDEGIDANCVGNRAWDGNEAITAAVYGDDSTGVHGGGDGATLTVSGKTWTVDALIGITVWNLSDAPANCLITDNNNTTVTCTLSGGTRDHWHDGDTFKITDGYPCRDQIGRGSDQTLDDGTYTGAHTAIQDLAPAYFWGNKYGLLDMTVEVDTGGYSDNQIRLNRDFYVGTAKPGYSAYTCPHPLAGLSGSCSSTTAGVAGYNLTTGSSTLGSGGTLSIGAGGGTITFGP